MGSRQKSLSNGKWLKKTLLLVAGAAIFFYYIHNRQVEQAASLQATSDKKVKKAAEAIAVLPPGTEEAWLAYVDRRVAKKLRRSGAVVQLVGTLDGIVGQSTYVSINSPYAISCDATGGSIEFGYPQQSSTEDDDKSGLDNFLVPIYGFMVDADRSAEKAPPFGVSDMSIAVRELDRRLCQRIADKVQSIMSPQAPLDGGAK